MPPQTLRIIDANCNRAAEGLRFLEDIARFLLNDVNLSRQIRAVRHDVVKNVTKLGAGLLSVRDSQADVGAGIEPVGQRQDLPSLVTANAKRVEEALRVIEESAKLPDIGPLLRSKDFEQARFDLYTLERELLSKVLRQDKLSRLHGLYVIIDTQALAGKDKIDAADKAIRGGARVIQLRDKHHYKGEILVMAQKLKDLCRQRDTLFIVNDYLDIALAADADGLHIGQADLPLPVVRKELPIDRIIGCSTRTLAQARKAEAEGADYVAVGSMFPSPTKGDGTVVGLERLRQIRKALSIPLVAIGGINEANIGKVIAAGVDSAAVISAVLSQENMEQATRRMVKAIEKETESHREPGSHC